MIKHKDDPFAVLGVNSWTHESGALKEVMQREKITWRSFDGSDALNKTWNNPVTPSFYLIDHEGLIRHHWSGKPRESVVDGAIERLIEKAKE